MGNRENIKSRSDESRREPFQKLNPHTLAAPFGAVVLLHLLGWLYPGSYTWGFSYWSLAGPAAIAVFVVAMVLLVPSVSAGLTSGFKSVLRPLKPHRKAGKVAWKAAAVIGVAAVFYLFRCRALVYGDGYTVLSDIAESETISFHLQSYFQILSLYFHHYVFDIVNSLTTWAPEKTFAAINVAGGLVGLWALVRLSGQLSTDATSRTFVLLGTLSSATVLLFFGYIESYTWALAMSLWSLSYAIGYAREENGPFRLVIFAVLAAAFHMVTLPFAVVALTALFIRGTPEGNWVFGVRLRTLNIVLAIGAVALAAMSHLARIDILVPLFAVDGNPYWVFSLRHLTDVFNELMLVSSLGVALLAVTLVVQRRRAFAVGVEDGILGTASLLTMLVLFWTNPDIGAPRDWDLLSFAGPPVTLWGLYRFTKLFPGRKVASGWVAAVAVILLVQVVPNLYEKNHPEIAVTRLDGLLNADPHYLADYRCADRCLAWAAVLQHGARRPDLAIKHLKRRAEAFEGSYQACFNLGDIYYRTREYDSAAFYMARGLSMKPDEMRFIMNLCEVEQKRGRYESAAKWASRAVSAEPGNVDALTQLGISLSYCGRHSESLAHFRKAYDLSPATYDQAVNLGLCHAMVGTTDSAYFYVCLALPHAPPKRKPDLYGFVIVTAMDLGRPQEAATYLEELKIIAPSFPDIAVLSSRLEGMMKR